MTTKPKITHDYYDYYLTVGGLKKAIKDLPDETPVYYQRIEDVYFKKYGWSKNSIKFVGEMDIEEEYTRAFCVVNMNQPGFFITAHY